MLPRPSVKHVFDFGALSSVAADLISKGTGPTSTRIPTSLSSSPHDLLLYCINTPKAPNDSPILLPPLFFFPPLSLTVRWLTITSPPFSTRFIPRSASISRCVRRSADDRSVHSGVGSFLMCAAGMTDVVRAEWRVRARIRAWIPLRMQGSVSARAKKQGD